MQSGQTRYKGLLFICMAAVIFAHEGLRGFTIAIHNSRLVFPEEAMRKFYGCLCFSRGECTFHYDRTKGTALSYSVLNVSDYLENGDGPMRKLAYVCDQFQFSFSSPHGITCAYGGSEPDECQQNYCSTKSYLSNLHDECPCISIQWNNFDVSIHYDGECSPTNTNCTEQQSTTGKKCSLQRPTTQTIPPTTSQGSGNKDTENSDKSSGDNQAAAIGAGLGSALAIVVIIAAVAVYVIWWRKKPAEQHPDKLFGAQPNSYVKSNISTNSGQVGISHEDNYGYTDYVEPGSMYYEIGEDGELAACRDEEVNAANISSEEPGDKIGAEGDEYSKLNAKKEVASNILETYDRAAGRFDDCVIGKHEISDKTSTDRTKGEEVSYSVAKSVKAEATVSGDEHVASAATSAPNQANDYFVLESGEDGRGANEKIENSDGDLITDYCTEHVELAPNPTADYFELESVEDKKKEKGEEDENVA